jgi:glycosyltransferase involved in cell wall biosynthesis
VLSATAVVDQPCHPGNASVSTYLDKVNSVLVITPCATELLPTQGVLIADRLRRAGVRTAVLSQAKSGWGRFLDILFRSWVLTPCYDVVLINVYGDRAFVYESVAILCARLWKKRTVAFIRNGRMPEFVAKWPRWTQFVLRRVTLILVPHTFLKLALAELGMQIDGIIPNFINLEQYRFKKRSTLAPRFLYLRGMHFDYNPEMAIRAFAIIQREYPGALLTMAGPEGNESSRCYALVREFGLQNVRFVGLVPKEQIPMLADSHDIHLHTNRVENMPVTIIEMWACGLPIVGTDVGGMPHLVHDGEDAILVQPEDHEGMARACLSILSNAQLASSLSVNGRRRAEELTWDNIERLWAKALFG